MFAPVLHVKKTHSQLSYYQIYNILRCMDGRAAILQQRYLLAELLVEQLLQEYQIAQQLKILM